jgi:hypothetical protein
MSRPVERPAVQQRSHMSAAQAPAPRELTAERNRKIQNMFPSPCPLCVRCFTHLQMR